MGLLFGIPLEVATALHRNTLLDYAGRIFDLAGLSVPAFYLGILLMLLLAVELDWFPVSAEESFPIYVTVSTISSSLHSLSD